MTRLSARQLLVLSSFRDRLNRSEQPSIPNQWLRRVYDNRPLFALIRKGLIDVTHHRATITELGIEVLGKEELQ